jgi:hypothetical protein
MTTVIDNKNSPWYSGFIAIGSSYYHIKWAIEEIEFLFDAQWKKRDDTRIVFNEKEGVYFPNTDFYEVTKVGTTYGCHLCLNIFASVYN